MSDTEHRYMLVNRTCPRCGKFSRLAIDAEAYRRWNNGALIQDAFKDMDADHRELLISGICLRCQKDVFKEDEDVEN